nr:hypothetical protein [Anaerolineales bacterium]
LETLVKALGAFFVRRDSKNPLYRLVLERYIQMATKEGVCQAVFLEGGLTRDGRLRPPKFGLIDYMLRGFEPETDRDIVLIPVGINYDRTLEDRSLLRTLDPQAEKRSRWFAIRTTIRFIWRNLVLMALNKWQRFGYACVNFGPVVSMRKYSEEHDLNFSQLDRDDRFLEIEKLCKGLMGSIQSVIPVLPISLVASVFLKSSADWLSDFDVKGQVYRLMEELEARGAQVYIPKRGRELGVTTALNMLRIRRMVIESDGMFRADPESRDILSYYANAIGHWHEASAGRSPS